MRRGDAQRAAMRVEAALGLPDRRLQETLRERLKGKADMVYSMSFGTVNKQERLPHQQVPRGEAGGGARRLDPHYFRVLTPARSDSDA